MSKARAPCLVQGGATMFTPARTTAATFGGARIPAAALVGARTPAAALVGVRSAAATLVAAALVASGCAGGGSLAVTSFADPFFPEDYRLELERCAFKRGGDGDWHILAQSSRAPKGALTGKVDQIVHAHAYWKPRPGKTPDDPTCLDARLRYVISTRGGVAAYEGDGFLYATRDRLTGRLSARVESASIRPVGKAGATPPEWLGEARLTGVLEAADDAYLAVDLRRELDLRAAQAQSNAAADSARP